MNGATGSLAPFLGYVIFERGTYCERTEFSVFEARPWYCEALREGGHRSVSFVKTRTPRSACAIEASHAACKDEVRRVVLDLAVEASFALFLKRVSTFLHVCLVPSSMVL